MSNVTYCRVCNKKYTSNYSVNICPDCLRMKSEMDKLRDIEEEKNVVNKKNSEVSLIKEKIYNIALDKALDENKIETLVNLIFHQHPDYSDYIYNQVIQIGVIFEKIAKKKYAQIIKQNIISRYDLENFDKSALKYFSPKFSGKDYDIFNEVLKNKNDYYVAIIDEIEQQEKKLAEIESSLKGLNKKKLNTENAKVKRLQKLNNDIEIIKNETQNNISTINENDKKTKTINSFCLGFDTSFIINLIQIIMYFAVLYFTRIKFSWYFFILFLSTGYGLNKYFEIKIKKWELIKKELSDINTNNEYKISEIKDVIESEDYSGSSYHENDEILNEITNQTEQKENVKYHLVCLKEILIKERRN